MAEDQALNDSPFVKPEKVELTPQPETVLDLDELMTRGRRITRTARFCIDGEAFDRLNELDEQIEDFDDAEGTDPDDEPMSGDRLSELQVEREEVRKVVAAAMRTVKMQALPDEEWRTLLDKHGGHADGKAFGKIEFWDELTAACAVKPTLTLAQATGLRKQLATPQLNEIHGAALDANSVGGVDIPKLPTSSRDRKRKERSSS